MIKLIYHIPEDSYALSKHEITEANAKNLSYFPDISFLPLTFRNAPAPMPMTINNLFAYFAADYGDENNWPFSKKEIEDFVKSDKEFIVKQR